VDQVAESHRRKSSKPLGPTDPPIRSAASPPFGFSNPFPRKLCHFFFFFKPSTTATMRLAHRLLMATPASMGSKSSLSEALALLPPLQLYRRILRVHRKLDPELRVLGDSYVKTEFRAHRTAENPLHIVRSGSWFIGMAGGCRHGVMDCD
jgi:hypothetical protein